MEDLFGITKPHQPYGCSDIFSLKEEYLEAFYHRGIILALLLIPISREVSENKTHNHNVFSILPQYLNTLQCVFMEVNSFIYMGFPKHS